MAKIKVKVFAPASRDGDESRRQHESDNVGLWAALSIGDQVMYQDRASCSVGMVPVRRLAVVRSKVVDVIDGDEVLTVELVAVIRHEQKYACLGAPQRPTAPETDRCNHLFGDGGRCCGVTGHQGEHICGNICPECDYPCPDRTAGQTHVF